MQLGLCCSSLQRAFAQNLQERLERNLGVSTLIVEEDSAPVSAVWEQASAADAVLLLLDSISAPGPVKRDDWESLLAHPGAPPVAMLRLGPCHYPKLLERRLFVASSSPPLAAERWVESWLVKMMTRHEQGIDAAPVSAPVPADWWERLVDRPGICFAGAGDIAAAQALAHQAHGHFQGVFWIGCQHRPSIGILGEIEHWSRTAERLLFVLVSPGWPLDFPGSRHSYLVLEGELPPIQSGDSLAPWVGVCQGHGFPASLIDLMLGPRPDWQPLATVLDRDRRLYRTDGQYTANQEAEERHLTVLEETFRAWRNHSLLCSELIAEAASAVRYGFQRHLPVARDLCLQLALFLLSGKRTPEAVFWLRMLTEEADRQSDLATARRARHELSWLVDDTGQLLHDEIGLQLTFEFDKLP
jgi:hypothetical protein